MVTPTGEPTLELTVYWQQFAEAIEGAITSVEEALQNVIDLNDLITDANTAIAAANAAADAAQDTATAITDASALANSFPTGATISATDAGANATITISAHTRRYVNPDGTFTDVAVNGGSLTGLAYSTFFYVYYDDAARAGGAVTYLSTTSSTTATQAGDRHVVGAVLTPAALDPDVTGTTVKGRGAGDLGEV